MVEIKREGRVAWKRLGVTEASVRIVFIELTRPGVIGMIKPVDIKHPPREKERKLALLTASAGLPDEIHTREEQFADPMDHLALKIVRSIHGRTDALPERNDIAVPKGDGLSPNGGQQRGAAVRIGGVQRGQRCQQQGGDEGEG